mmetsp:Transcript_116396/g.324340  ORF Transcript_116396/g.324340 Transcript_116396/m.324340 type:complete len:205 (+) Transcript_116396:62-676(+)
MAHSRIFATCVSPPCLLLLRPAVLPSTANPPAALARRSAAPPAGPASAPARPPPRSPLTSAPPGQCAPQAPPPSKLPAFGVPEGIPAALSPPPGSSHHLGRHPLPPRLQPRLPSSPPPAPRCPLQQHHRLPAVPHLAALATGRRTRTAPAPSPPPRRGLGGGGARPCCAPAPRSAKPAAPRGSVSWPPRPRERPPPRGCPAALR